MDENVNEFNIDELSVPSDIETINLFYNTDYLIDPLEGLVEKSDVDALIDALGKISRRHRLALTLRYGLHGEPLTFRRVGEVLNVCPARAEQIVNTAIRKLRKLATNPAYKISTLN